MKQNIIQNIPISESDHNISQNIYIKSNNIFKSFITVYCYISYYLLFYLSIILFHLLFYLSFYCFIYFICHSSSVLLIIFSVYHSIYLFCFIYHYIYHFIYHVYRSIILSVVLFIILSHSIFPSVTLFIVLSINHSILCFSNLIVLSFVLLFYLSGPGVLDFEFRPDVSHSCKKDLLLCRRRGGANSPWRRIRLRPIRNNFQAAFVLCRGASPVNCSVTDELVP